MLVERLRWDGANRDHATRHGVRQHVFDDMIEVGQYEAFRDRRETRNRLIIGYTSLGRFVTLCVEPTEVATTWRPITGWWSTPDEIARYRLRRLERERRARSGLSG